MIFKYISIKIFIVSLAVGLLFTYLSNPEPTIIHVYPTPHNVKYIEYKDKADNCFQYDANEVKCPKDISSIKTIPIQR
jgi:hypothetical protein